MMTGVGTQSPLLGSTNAYFVDRHNFEGGDGLDQHQLISRMGYKLCYPQLFTHLKRPNWEKVNTEFHGLRNILRGRAYVTLA